MQNIYDLNFNELASLLQTWGEPAYRAKQVWGWVYTRFARSPGEMSDLPRALRERLAGELSFSHLTPEVEMRSGDGETVKRLFSLSDGRQIEAVLMRYHDRRTACISTQAGCGMGCVFCATGQMGFLRHLSAGEIVEQVIFYAGELHRAGDRLTNIVVMGMGEPFHNYDATMQAIDRLNDPAGFNFGARRITVSTVGLVPMIQRFAGENRQVNLAVSLHAATDDLRSEMLPINRKYPLAVLMPACRDYVQKTGRRITFEWALIQGKNDTPAQAAALADLTEGLMCHVNVIPLNPTHDFAGAASTRERAAAFRDALLRRGIPCTIRVRRGIDINAGCGQLANVSSRSPVTSDQ